MICQKMVIDYTIIDIITIVISSIIAYSCFKKISGNMYCIIYAIFFIFYVFPLFLDYIVLFPDYSLQKRYYGFNLSYRDSYTRIVYDVLLIIIQYAFSRKVRQHVNCENRPGIFNNDHLWFLVLGMIIPTILVFILGINYNILFSFGWREMELYTYNSATHIVEEFSYFGVFSSILLLFNKKKRTVFINTLCFIFLYINLCLQGKRSILFFAIVIACILLIPGVRDVKRKDKKKMLLVAALSIIGVAIMIGLTIYVKVSVRGWDENDAVDLYTMTRIDFFKDDRVRFAIYSFLYPEKVTILKEFGQTVFPTITWFYPLNSILAQNGYVYLNYQEYFSSALQDVVSHAFMTTCYFAELISNFGVLGPILMYILMVLFARYASNSNYIKRMMLLVCFMALQMYTTQYLAMFFESCIFYFIIYFYGNRNKVR